MSLLTRDMQNLSTAAGQVIHNFLKEGEVQRFTKNDLVRICSVLTTAQYCLETVQQLEDKLKEKIAILYANKIDMSEEKDVFHRIISNCIQLLVQDLEAGCEPSLQVMSKIQWQNISNVGDQSAFISSIYINFKQTVPVIRDNLITSRKYFTQFCHKFVNVFIPKYINVLYKCKLTTMDSASNILGCEQLLLDTHSLKTALMDLPSIGSSVNRKAPTSYTKVVVKDMTRAEMIIKVVMTPIHPTDNFVQQVLKLLPDITISEYQKILDMKTVKRADQMSLIDVFQKTASTVAAVIGSDIKAYNMELITSTNSVGNASTTMVNTMAVIDSTNSGGNQENTTNVINDITNVVSTTSTNNNDAALVVPPTTVISTPTPKKKFLFGMSNLTGGSSNSNAEKLVDGSSTTPAGSNDKGRIRKLENLLKRHLP